MSTTATTHLPSGIYRIIVSDGDLESQLLTNGAKDVTVLPINVGNDPQQEWRIEHSASEDDTIIITRGPPIIPSLYLSFRGAHNAKPKAGDRIMVQRMPFAPNKWRVKLLPTYRSLMHVEGSQLGIGIAPPDIHPPFLELKDEGQLQWRFQFLRNDD